MVLGPESVAAVWGEAWQQFGERPTPTSYLLERKCFPLWQKHSLIRACCLHKSLCICLILKMIWINHYNVDCPVFLWGLPNNNPVNNRITHQQINFDRNGYSGLYHMTMEPVNHVGIIIHHIRKIHRAPEHIRRMNGRVWVWGTVGDKRNF